MAEDKVLWTFVDANAPNEKKRIRTTTTSLACEACSKKHLKCDGVQPTCARCTKSGQLCVYVAKRRKRNPANQQSENRTLSTTEATIENVSSALLLENHLSHSFSFSTYIQIYEDHINAFVLSGEVGVIDREYNAFQDTHDSRKLLFMNGVLATGALLWGNRRASDEYYMNASTLMKDLLHDPNVLVAATHSLFANRYSLEGELTKSELANSFARKLFGQLLRTKPHEQSEDGTQVATHYLRCLVAEIEISPLGANLPSKVRKIAALNAQLDIAPVARSAFKVFCEMALLRHDALMAPTEHMPQYLNWLMNSSKQLPSTAQMKPAVGHRLTMILARSYTAIHLANGNYIEAIEDANTIVKLATILGSGYHDAYMVKSLFCAGQVYVRLGLTGKFYKLAELLQKVAANLPVASRCLRRLQQLKYEIDLHGGDPEFVSQIPISVGWLWELVELPPQITRTTPTMSHLPLPMHHPAPLMHMGSDLDTTYAAPELSVAPPFVFSQHYSAPLPSVPLTANSNSVDFDGSDGLSLGPPSFLEAGYAPAQTTTYSHYR